MTFRGSSFLLITICVCIGIPASAQVSTGGAHAIHSAVLNEERHYQVALPESYSWETDRRYPVLVVLDGESQFQHSAATANFLATRGDIPEMIVVGLKSTVRIRDFTQTDWPEAWIGGGGAPNFTRFLSTEFLPAIERQYRTDGFRVLSGHSASAQFVLYCLTSEPALFQAYIALSPSLDWDHNLPQRSLEQAFRKTDRLSAFLYVARSDDAGRALADYNRLLRTLKTTAPKGFRWFSRAFPDETHVSIPLRALIDALRRLYHGYRFHPDLMPKGVAFAEKHFQEVSKTVGWTLPVPESVINEFAYEALARKNTREAIALFTRNVAAHPNSANAWDGLADGHAEAGQWTEAVAAAQKAVALATQQEHPNLSYFIGQEKKMKERAAQKTAE